MDSLRTLITDSEFSEHRVMVVDEPGEILNRVVRQFRFAPALITGCRVPTATIIPLSWSTR
jgi:hypothetical protein